MRRNRNAQSGVALLLTLMAVLILSAIAASIVLMSSTETAVNSNYRSEETAFFAARAGVYEVTDRMMQANASTIASQIPTAVPTAANGGILYLINQTSGTGNVQPWSASNTYADTELCHEGYTLAGMNNASPDVSCTTVPNGTGWYATASSNAPWNGTTAAMPYEWVRVNWKLNNSQSYLSGTTTGGTTTLSTSNYSVNGGQSAATPVCWNGASEVLLASADTNCGQMQSGSPATAATPVYLVTAMAVTPSGARQIVQAEVALPPAAVISTPAGFSDPDGFFAVSNTCSGTSSPLSIGGNATTDGYSSANGGTYNSTHSASLGSVGSNGSVSISGSSSHVGGNVHVQHTAVNGSCSGSPPSDVFTNGSGASYGGVVQIGTYSPTTPTIPAPGTADETIKSSVTLVGGSYHNIDVSTPNGSLTLTAPGVYNINCLSVGSNSTLSISPATAQVVINVTGTSCPSGGSPISLSSNSVTNTSGVAANLLINYAGNLSVTITGGASAYYVLNAPNAGVTIHGGSDIYGAVIASTIDDSGGVNLHFDNALTSAPSNSTTSTSTSTSNYQTISFRSLPY